MAGSISIFAVLGRDPFPCFSAAFDGIVTPKPLEQAIIFTRTKFCITRLLVSTIHKGEHGLLIYCAVSYVRSSWLANLLKHPEGIRDLITPYRLAEYLTQNTGVLEGLRGTLCPGREVNWVSALMGAHVDVFPTLTGMVIWREQHHRSKRIVHFHGASGAAHGSGTKSTCCRQLPPR